MGYEPLKEETRELYLKIWINFSVGHLSKEQLAQVFQCSHDTVSNAIEWAAENRAKFSSAVLVESAKEALVGRIRELKNDLVRIKEATPVNWNAVIGMNKIIKENEELLWKLESVIPDKSFITINAMQVNQLAQVRDEVMEVLNESDRQELAMQLRQIIQKADGI